MSLLSKDQRLRVLAGLVDGNSERAIERMAEVSRPTISRFALRVGEGAQYLHDQLVRDVSCSFIEMDEVWGWWGRKPHRTEPDDPDAGEAWSWVALDKLSRLVIAWYVGGRDEEAAQAFMADVRWRLVVMPQIATDGLAAYEPAVEAAFGRSVAYAQVVKDYGSKGQRSPDHRYEPPRNPFITKRVVFGAPDLDEASTSHVERNNGTMRHKIGRMRRLCYAFSKKLPNHRAAAALNYC